MLDLRHTPSRGRALHATRALERGTLLVTEEPLASMQLPGNAEAVVSCMHCLRLVGSLETQLQHATRHVPTRRKWSLGDALDGDDDGVIAADTPCTGGCGARFCSQACQAAAAAGGHELLCAPPSGKSAHALAVAHFREHALAEYSGFYLFGATLVCLILAALRSRVAKCSSCFSGGLPCQVCLSAARAPLAPFCRSVWWDIAHVGGDTAAESARYRKAIRASALESLRRLRAALEAQGVEARHVQWLTADEWGQLLGLARQNSLCVEVESPMRDFLCTLRAWAAGCEEDNGVSALLETVDEAEVAAAEDDEGEEGAGCVPEAVMGTALYPQISCLNHSCAPNCHVRFARDGGDHTATLQTTRRVAEGEELTISYIDCNERARVDERRAELVEYGFRCECVKCEAESGWKRRLRPRLAARPR